MTTTKRTTYSVRNHDGSVVESTHAEVEAALDAREGGETVWHDAECRELTEAEIFG